MIKKNMVSGLKYLIITGAILVFAGLVSSSETFAQLSTFSGSGGYGYPGSFYGGYPGYGYPYGGYGSYSMPYGYAGYSRYDYPGSSYGGYSGYSYPGYVSWSGPFAYSQDSSQWMPLYQYSSGPGPGIPNPFNPIYGLVPPGYGPLWASTHYPVGSPLFQFTMNALLKSEYYPGQYAIEKNIAYSLLPRLLPF